MSEYDHEARVLRAGLLIARSDAGLGILLLRLALMAARRGDWRRAELLALAGWARILDAKFVLDPPLP